MSSPKGQEQSILGRAGQGGSGESGNLLMLHMVTSGPSPGPTSSPNTLEPPTHSTSPKEWPTLPQQVSPGFLKKLNFVTSLGRRSKGLQEFQ